MANILRVNTTRLGRDADKVQKYINSMKKSSETLRTQSTSLDKMWDGPSSDAFKKAFHDDLKLMTTILNNLEKINRYENTAKKKYEDCEKKVDSIISSIKI